MYGNGDEGGLHERWFKRPELLLIALIGLLYLALNGRYNTFDLDSRWFPSFSYAFWVDHIQTDPFMRGTFPDGMGGVAVFGKLAAVVQGALLNLIGWSLPAATFISTAFVLCSLLLFANISRRLGYSTSFTLCFVAMLGLTEPFLATAERARYEFLPVFLLSLALWIAVRPALQIGARWNVVLAMFVAALSVEIEPSAVVIPCAVATFLLATNARTKAFSLLRLSLLILLGSTTAAAFLFFLHPHIISLLQSADWTVARSKAYIPIPGGFVAAYYYAYARHLPELAVLLAALAACIARKDRRRLLVQWPALCIAVVLIGAIVLRWPNPAYFAFISPFICLFVLQVFYPEQQAGHHTGRRRNWILAAVLLFTLPQYVRRYKLWQPQRVTLSQHDQGEVDAAITRAAATIGKPAQQLSIVGNYAFWFAHPHGFVNLNVAIATPALLQNSDLLLCLNSTFNPDAVTTQEITCEQLNSIKSTLLETVELRGHQLQLRAPVHSH